MSSLTQSNIDLYVKMTNDIVEINKDIEKLVQDYKNNYKQYITKIDEDEQNIMNKINNLKKSFDIKNITGEISIGCIMNKVSDIKKERENIKEFYYNKLTIYHYYLCVVFPLIFFDSYLGFFDNLYEFENINLFGLNFKTYLQISSSIKLGYFLLIIYPLIEFLSNYYIENNNIYMNSLFCSKLIFYTRIINLIWDIIGAYFLLNIIDSHILLFVKRIITCLYLFSSFFVKYFDGFENLLITNIEAKLIIKKILIKFNLISIITIVFFGIMIYWF